MKKAVTLLILILNARLIFAQVVFQKTIGDTANWETGKDLQITSDGGYIITGTRINGTLGRAYLLKTDADGNVEWMKDYEGAYGSIANSVRQTADGGYIMAGGTNILPNAGGYNSRTFLVKTDANGDTLWTKMYGDSTSNYFANCVRQTTDQGYIILCGDDNGLYDNGSLIRTDSTGNLLWSKLYGGWDLNRVWQTADGGFAMTGSDLAHSFTIVKTDSTGTFLWRKRHVNWNEDYSAESSALTSDGGYILAGFHQYLSINDCYLLRADSSGEMVWRKLYQLPVESEIRAVQQTADGGFIAAGVTLSANINKMILLKTDSAGDVTWMKYYDNGTLNSQFPYSIAQNQDGGFILAGYINSGTEEEVYLVKTDSMGFSGCNDSLVFPVVTVPIISTLNQTIFSNYPSGMGNPIVTINPIIPLETEICASFVSIEENPFDHEMIFPNPFTTEISIVFQKQNIQQVSINIKNIFGQTIFTNHAAAINMKQKTRLNLSFLPAGIYLFEIIIDGERTVKKNCEGLIWN